MRFFSLKDFDFRNKRVLLRVDFNVPIDEKGNITSTKRIKEALPTIRFLLSKKSKLIIISHLGQPKGYDEKLKLDNVAKALEKLLNKKVVKLNDCIDVKIPDSDIVVLENLRFHKEEEENNIDFARKLAKNADYYVNDAFGTCHRSHASIDGITKFLPSAAGFLLEKEINAIKKNIEKPKRPFIAIVGGVKISSKIDVINSLLKKSDRVLIGGAMMFTFLKAQGFEVGDSLVENDKIELAKNLLKNKKIILPVDTVIADSLNEKAKTKTVTINKISKQWIGLDIGPETINNYAKIIKKSKTIVWNGPLGKFEWKNFSKGTNEIAKAVAKSSAVSVICGGDTVSAVEKLKLEKKFSHVSTGGGASLDLIGGKILPGIKALEENYNNFNGKV